MPKNWLENEIHCSIISLRRWLFVIHAVLRREQAADYGYTGESEQGKRFWMCFVSYKLTAMSFILFVSFLAQKWCDLPNFELKYFCWELDVSDYFQYPPPPRPPHFLPAHVNPFNLLLCWWDCKAVHDITDHWLASVVFHLSLITFSGHLFLTWHWKRRLHT